jgi:hypothetical protein
MQPQMLLLQPQTPLLLAHCSQRHTEQPQMLLLLAYCCHCNTMQPQMLLLQP